MQLSEKGNGGRSYACARVAADYGSLVRDTAKIMRILTEGGEKSEVVEEL